MAERSIAAVLKTVDVKASWGSNPYSSAKQSSAPFKGALFILQDKRPADFCSFHEALSQYRLFTYLPILRSRILTNKTIARRAIVLSLMISYLKTKLFDSLFLIVISLIRDIILYNKDWDIEQEKPLIFSSHKYKFVHGEYQ
jgi:hypothetical protein